MQNQFLNYTLTRNYQMKYKSLIPVLAVATIPCVSHAVISMDFTNLTQTVDNASTDVGDVWTATNVVDLGGSVGSVNALFTVVSSNLNDNQFAFVPGEASRGDDARVRFDNITGITSEYNYHVEIKISFVDPDNGNAAVSFNSGELQVQFDDLDSHSDVNLADYAGVLTSDIGAGEFSSNTILESNTTLVSGATVGVLQSDGAGLPYDSAGNVTGTDPLIQSPVTAGFTIADSAAALGEFTIVVGVTGTEFGTRHVDIDMTPDFVIVPEASSYGLLLGLGMIATVAMRRRSK